MIPLWLKIGYTAIVAVILPIYWLRHGPKNFLWFSDIALILLVPALWLESALLFGMMAVGVLLPEAVWTISYLGGLLFRRPFTGLAGYMFDPALPRWLRGLSLFHLILPPLLIWGVWRLGYDSRALALQTLLAWAVLPVTWLVTDPAKNINWVFGPGERPQRRIDGRLYLGFVMLFFPVCVYLPTHWLLSWLFTAKEAGGNLSLY
ncbi:membrane-associated protein [Lentisalinibacter orientalis]|uniref:membrane-associated protein n=1 Tax=Lentisalinibacter orientalis TaxID=2992241 RepID=UPI003865DC13